ncbi:hypothetical protein [Rhizobium quercicola]|nr:hypothetical protein [Rhizobium quercicola]
MMQQNLIVPNEDKPFAIVQVLRIGGFTGARLKTLEMVVKEG